MNFIKIQITGSIGIRLTTGFAINIKRMVLQHVDVTTKTYVLWEISFYQPTKKQSPVLLSKKDGKDGSKKVL